MSGKLGLHQWLLLYKPVVDALLPVRIAARLGAHLGLGACAFVNKSPRLASASMFGVGTRSLPRHPIQSFMSSTEMNSTLGRVRSSEVAEVRIGSFVLLPESTANLQLLHQSGSAFIQLISHVCEVAFDEIKLSTKVNKIATLQYMIFTSPESF